MINIGTVVRLITDCLGNKAGNLGVCYDIYTLNGRGVSVIFENGEYDGFSEPEQKIFLKETREEKTLQNYKFSNVMKVSNDYNNGLFDQAFR